MEQDHWGDCRLLALVSAVSGLWSLVSPCGHWSYISLGLWGCLVTVCTLA